MPNVFSLLELVLLWAWTLVQGLLQLGFLLLNHLA